ncbi:MAG: hypothetical protein J6K45_04720 [Clostridia bacterium]|nr:hypothetical protein [Clostridia bacterium]
MDLKIFSNGVFDSLWGIAKAPLNAIIKGINKMIEGANKIRIDVPKGVPGIGGIKFGINIPKLQELGKGGVVAKPTPVITGEAGAEMIMPLENNLEYLDILADKLASKIGSGGGYYILNIDSKTVQRGMAQRSNELAFAKNGR